MTSEGQHAGQPAEATSGGPASGDFPPGVDGQRLSGRASAPPPAEAFPTSYGPPPQAAPNGGSPFVVPAVSTFGTGPSPSGTSYGSARVPQPEEASPYGSVAPASGSASAAGSASPYGGASQTPFRPADPFNAEGAPDQSQSPWTPQESGQSAPPGHGSSGSAYGPAGAPGADGRSFASASPAGSAPGGPASGGAFGNASPAGNAFGSANPGDSDGGRFGAGSPAGNAAGPSGSPLGAASFPPGGRSTQASASVPPPAQAASASAPDNPFGRPDPAPPANTGPGGLPTRRPGATAPEDEFGGRTPGFSAFGDQPVRVPGASLSDLPDASNGSADNGPAQNSWLQQNARSAEAGQGSDTFPARRGDSGGFPLRAPAGPAAEAGAASPSPGPDLPVRGRQSAGEAGYPASGQPPFGQQPDRPGVFGQQPDRPGAPGAFGQEPDRPGIFGQRPDSPRAFGQEPDRPGTPGAFGQEPDRPGIFGQQPDRPGAPGAFGQQSDYPSGPSAFGQQPDRPGMPGAFGEQSERPGAYGTQPGSPAPYGSPAPFGMQAASGDDPPAGGSGYPQRVPGAALGTGGSLPEPAPTSGGPVPQPRDPSERPAVGSARPVTASASVPGVRVTPPGDNDELPPPSTTPQARVYGRAAPATSDSDAGEESPGRRSDDEPSGGFPAAPQHDPSGGFPSSAQRDPSGGYPSSAQRDPSGGFPASAQRDASGGFPASAQRDPSGGFPAASQQDDGQPGHGALTGIPFPAARRDGEQRGGAQPDSAPFPQRGSEPRPGTYGQAAAPSQREEDGNPYAPRADETNPFGSRPGEEPSGGFGSPFSGGDGPNGTATFGAAPAPGDTPGVAPQSPARATARASASARVTPPDAPGSGIPFPQPGAPGAPGSSPYSMPGSPQVPGAPPFGSPAQPGSPYADFTPGADQYNEHTTDVAGRSSSPYVPAPALPPMPGEPDPRSINATYPSSPAARATVTPPGPEETTSWPGPADEPGRFDQLKSSEPAEPVKPAKVRTMPVTVAVVLGAGLLLGLIFGLTWLIAGDDQFEVAQGDCVKRDGDTPVVAACSESGTFQVVSIATAKEQCADPAQPYIVIPKDGDDQVLCLKPNA